MSKSLLLIFDLDGTLIDSRADLAEGINHMRAQFGLDSLSIEMVGGYVGNGVRKLVERSIEGSNVDIDDALLINKKYTELHPVVHTRLYPGVEEGLQSLLKAGHKLAVLTNKQGEQSREILRRLGIDLFFSNIIGGGDVAHLKPEPDGIHLCLKTTGIDPINAWMIGDHYTDLSVAKNAGIKSAFAQYGFGEPRGFEPRVYFASFPELVGYFIGR